MLNSTIDWKRPQDTPEARRRREAKIERLLYGGDDDVLGKAYDGRLLSTYQMCPSRPRSR
jgi:hypothetical protein